MKLFHKGMTAARVFGLATLCGAPFQAKAAPVNAATDIFVMSAVPGGDFLQVGELIAIEIGTGINVALAANGGTASASTTYIKGTSWLPGPGDYVPYNTIDGVFPASFPAIWHSGTPQAVEFLRITLAAPTDLSSLTIYGRADCCWERDHYLIQIFNAASEVLFSGELDGREAAGGPTTVNFDVAPVPVPAALPLFASGLGVIVLLARQKRKADTAA